MPRAPRSRQRSASPSGSSSRLSRTNGNSRSGASAAQLQHAVVGRAVGGLAVGLVEREDVRAAHAGLVHEAQVLLERRARGRPRRARDACARRTARSPPGGATSTRSPCAASSSSARSIRAASDTYRSLYALRMAEATPLGADSRAPARTRRAELRRGDRPPARAVRRRHRVRHPGRAHARDLPRPRRLRHPPRLAAPRAGRGVHGRRLRARRGQARRVRR